MTESEHFIGKVAQKAVIEKGGKVLIQTDARDSSGLWDLPGGRLHRDEALKDGLSREIREELGVEAEIGDIFHTSQFMASFDGERRVMLVYRAALKDPEAQFALDPVEVGEIKWITSRELDNANLYPELHLALEKFFDLSDK